MAIYNKGQKYEQGIQRRLIDLGYLPDDLKGNDAGFIHLGMPYFLEVKNKKAPDFGQKGIIWNRETGWEWRQPDIITEMYNSIGAIRHINENFIPRRYSIPQKEITQSDKKYDQQSIKKSGIELNDPDLLFEYYARKQCYYIQIEEKGFYYLKEDIAELNVPQFKPKLSFRLRAKTHNSLPIYNYSFFAVINVYVANYPRSKFDIEEKVGVFPPIIP